MTTYKVKIACGNCCSERNYEIEKGVVVFDAGLICPNCTCSPTEQNYVIITKDKKVGTATHKKEEGDNQCSG